MVLDHSILEDRTNYYYLPSWLYETNLLVARTGYHKQLYGYVIPASNQVLYPSISVLLSKMFGKFYYTLIISCKELTLRTS